MTLKEIADRIRATATVHTDPDLLQLADELDPPRPEPGTVVRWRYVYFENNFIAGVVAEGGDGVIDSEQEFHEWCYIDYKPARILAPGEVALPLGVAKAIAGEQSHYNQKLYTAFAVEARATLAKQIAIAEAEG